MNKTLAAKTVFLAAHIYLASLASPAQSHANAQPQAHIPLDQLGAVAGKQYQGDGLAICTTPNGARLHCVFQRLEGEATRDGLWLSSTAEGSPGERFRVVVVEVGHVTPCAPFPDLLNPGAQGVTHPTMMLPNLPVSGIVSVAHNLARFIRDGLTEEYSVSMDGVRQDFVIQQRPTGDGELRVELDVTGATVEPLADGARLTLTGSGRKLAYARLNVTDADGRELTARIEVAGEDRLAVMVDDMSAAYPVRIDPTFSDEDWISMESSLGPNVSVSALAVSGSDLYANGFQTTSGSPASHIAKWNGSSWTALGSGFDGWVSALAVSGSDLYAGGNFTTATNSGDIPVAVINIAKWNGSGWSTLGSGLDGSVSALAVSGSNLYVSGFFTTATNSGGTAVTVNSIAKWNGSGWSTLGSGLDGPVLTLAVSGSDLYASGLFEAVGGSGFNYIAKWNGSNWSALGSGLGGTGVGAPVAYALTASGSDLYAGGYFTTAGGSPVNQVAKWDGNAWSALGSGVGGGRYVNALVVTGADLYAGGDFTTAGGSPANRIAKWDGNGWSALGSGMDNEVYALAVSGTALYAGGYFTTAGGKASAYLAKAKIGGNSSPGHFGSLVFSPATGFNFTFSGGTVGQSYRIQTSPSPAVGPWTDFTNFTYTGPTVITDASAGSGINKFFRAVSP